MAWGYQDYALGYNSGAVTNYNKKTTIPKKESLAHSAILSGPKNVHMLSVPWTFQINRHCASNTVGS